MSQYQTLIFVCEHGAAKSIIAATHFNRIAEGQALPFRAIARGTNPDPELSEQTVLGLSRDELTPVAFFPQKLSVDDVQAAQRIISFCELPMEYRMTTIVEQWDGVPTVSEDYDKARDIILEHIHDLLNRLRSSP